MCQEYLDSYNKGNKRAIETCWIRFCDRRQREIETCTDMVQIKQ